MDTRAKIVSTGTISIVFLVAGACILSGYYSAINKPSFPKKNLCIIGETLLDEKECINYTACCDPVGVNADDCVDFCIRSSCWNLVGILVTLLDPKDIISPVTLVTSSTLKEINQTRYDNFANGAELDCWVNLDCVYYGENQNGSCISLSFNSPDSMFIAGWIITTIGAVLFAVMIIFKLIL